jgi:hypothetical protein
VRALNEYLQANQDGNRRTPLVELMSIDPTDAIPMAGSILTAETVNENAPAVLIHSLGRMVGCYIYGPYTYETLARYSLKFFYTDTGKTSVTIVDLGLNGLPVIQDVSICEMTDGKIAVVYLENDVANHLYRIKYRIVSVLGVESSAGEIDSWSHDLYSNGVSVLYNPAANNYLVVRAGIGTSPNYEIFTKTSTNFVTWGARGVIATVTTTKKLSSPSLMYDPERAKIWLWFTALDDTGSNGEELTNVYSTTSADGTTWGAPAAFTEYDSFDTVGNHGRSVLKSATQMYAMFNEEKKSLIVNYLSDGWEPPLVTSGPGETGIIGNVHFDAATRKLYVTSVGNVGVSVMKVDVDTWSIDEAWSSLNADFHAIFNAKRTCLWPYSQKMAKIGNVSKYTAIGTYQMMPTAFVQILDGDEGSIFRSYAFGAQPTYGITQNVTSSISYPYTNLSLLGIHIDLVSDKVWFLSGAGSDSQGYFAVGYIPFSETGESENFTYTQLFTNASFSHWNANKDIYMKVYPASDMILVYGYNHDGYGPGTGFACIYSLSTGALIKEYSAAGYPNFPALGLTCAEIVGNKLYGGFPYSTAYSQGSNYGMMVLDLATDAVSFQRPTFATVNDYGFNDIKVMDDGRFLISSNIYALVIFDPVANTWLNYNNANNPGWTTPFSDWFYLVEYDETNELVFSGLGDPAAAVYGAIAVSVYGGFKQTQYKIGNYIDGAWSWGERDNMVLDNNIYDLFAAMDDEAGILYAFGVEQITDETSIWWDTEAPAFDFGPFWVRNTDLALKWTVDANPGTLEFTLSHGHLFDPFNLASLYKKYAEKGRKISVRLGELVDGTPRWENQGTYVITERRMSGYQRGQVPTMEITAEDMRTLWQFHGIVASEAYEDDPTDIIEDLLEDFDEVLDAGDFSWPAIDNKTILYHQWMDTPLLDAVYQVLDRYGYFLKIDRDNKISAAKIALDNAVNHIYPSNIQLLKFTPDDTFSDFTNRIIVVGQERTYIEVLYPEERINALNGTCGWWGYKNDFPMYYSDDKSRRARFPRLVVLESASSIAFTMAGGVSEALSFTDPNELYCVITVIGPDLVPALVIAIIAWALFHLVPDLVIGVAEGFIFNIVEGFTIRVGTFLQAVALFVILSILASVGNFQFEIWACPIGYVRRSLQATADDYDGQNTIGKVVTKKIEEPLCYTAADCQMVANHERDVAQAQRKRIKFSKISHLQDEEGDTITIVHPASGQTMDVFITDLTRKYNVPEGPGNEEASCIDEIEGWCLTS